MNASLATSRYFLTVLTILLLTACGQRGISSPAVPDASAIERGDVPTSITHTGNFTEYTLPAGLNPSFIVKGDADTVWFVPCRSHMSTLYRLTASTGAVRAFVPPAPYAGSFNCPIANAGDGILRYVVVDPTQQNEDFLANATQAGAYTFSDLAADESTFTNFALASESRLWYAYCLESCGTNSAFVASIGTNGVRGPSVALGNTVQPLWVNLGSDNNLWVTSVYNGPPIPNPPSIMWVVSQTGAILHLFPLPAGSYPAASRTGPDGNVWILDVGGKVYRMQRNGTLTTYSVPTANAQPSRITNGTDGALWFTEAHAAKIARITTSGAITEYQVPTMYAGPTGIVSCQTAVCGAHGGLWFTETSANKIGLFRFP
jgi:streptogramin lyase